MAYTAFPGSSQARAFIQSPAKARGGQIVEVPACIIFGEVYCGGYVQGATVRALRNGQVIGTATTNSQGQYIINIYPGGADTVEVVGAGSCNFPPKIGSYSCPGEHYVPFAFGCPYYKPNNGIMTRFFVDVTYRVRVFCLDSPQNPFIDGCGGEIGGGIVNAKVVFEKYFLPGVTPTDVPIPYQITVQDVYGETDQSQFATCQFPVSGGLGRTPLTPEHLVPTMPYTSLSTFTYHHLLEYTEGKYYSTPNTQLSNLARGLSVCIPFSAVSVTFNPLAAKSFNHFFFLGFTDILDCFTNYTSIRGNLIPFYYKKSYESLDFDFFHTDPISNKRIYKYPLPDMEEPEYFCGLLSRTKIEIISNSSYADVFFLP